MFISLAENIYEISISFNMPLKDLIKAKRKANLNRRKPHVKKESFTATDKRGSQSKLSDDGCKINYLETRSDKYSKRSDHCCGSIDKAGKHCEGLSSETKLIKRKDIDLKKYTENKKLDTHYTAIDDRFYYDTDNFSGENKAHIQQILKHTKPENDKILKIKQKDSNPCKVIENDLECVLENKHDCTDNSDECLIDSDKAFCVNEIDCDKISVDSTPYMPSWFCESDMKEMDRKGVKLNKTAKKSLSMSDVRLNDGSVLGKKTLNNHLRNVHEVIEKEYLNLKKELRLNDSSQTASREISRSTVPDTLSRVSLSDTALPGYGYKQLLESDELGINHFRKHIHNVKISNKKYRRSLKNMETMAPSVCNTRHSKRKMLGFKPLYERKHTELAMETSNDD